MEYVNQSNMKKTEFHKMSFPNVAAFNWLKLQNHIRI